MSTNNEWFRARRMRVFLSKIDRLPRPFTILDVGGTTEFWKGRLPEGCHLSILNVFPQEPIQGEQVYVGTATSLPFADKSFDVVFSNSALAFVGSRYQQQQMADEIRRVGVRYYVQTPNQDFPIDWRTMVPFFHWLKPGTQAWILNSMRVGRYPKMKDPMEAVALVNRVKDVDYPVFKVLLFPDAEIIREKILGLTKSLIAYRF